MLRSGPTNEGEDVAVPTTGRCSSVETCLKSTRNGTSPGVPHGAVAALVRPHPRRPERPVMKSVPIGQRRAGSADRAVRQRMVNLGVEVREESPEAAVVRRGVDSTPPVDTLPQGHGCDPQTVEASRNTRRCCRRRHGPRLAAATDDASGCDLSSPNRTLEPTSIASS